MLFNCPLNALGAVLGVSYGRLGESKWTKRVMELIIDEVFRVMAVAGYRTYWSSKEAYLPMFYDTLIPRTAGHFASTLQDIQAGKRTEIHALNGAIVRLGEAHDLVVPMNKVMYQTILYLESKA